VIVATSSHGGILTARRRSQPRLTGIDLARFIAIIGMVMVHFGPNPVPETTLGQIYEVSHGRASILFVLLAGIGVTFLANSTDQTGTGISAAHILSRAAILLPLGLWLQDLDHGVLVILQFYAAYFVFAALLVRFSSPLIIGAALAFIALGPVMYEVAETYRTEWFLDGAPVLGDPASKIFRDLTISGYYPLVTWAAPLTLGVWLGRQDLGSMSSRLILILGGAALVIGSSIVARGARAIDVDSIQIAMANEPHSQTHTWLIGAIGSAIIVLGISLIVVDLAPQASWPLVAAGQLALSVYVGHLLLLHRYTDVFRQDTVTGAITSVVIFSIFAVTVCAVWRSFFSRGPLEMLFRVPSWIINRFQRG
jgi:uncharacterized membrane protein